MYSQIHPIAAVEVSLWSYEEETKRGEYDRVHYTRVWRFKH